MEKVKETIKETHPIETIMEQALTKLKGIIDVNTIVGTPTTLIDGTTIIPVSRVSFGFVAGGGEYSDSSYGKKHDRNYPFGGGSGGGINISPVGFLSIANGEIKILSMDSSTAYDKLFDIGGDVLKKLIKKE